MANDKIVQIPCSSNLYERIAEFRLINDTNSQAAAARKLIELGLKVAENVNSEESLGLETYLNEILLSCYKQEILILMLEQSKIKNSYKDSKILTIENLTEIKDKSLEFSKERLSNLLYRDLCTR